MSDDEDAVVDDDETSCGSGLGSVSTMVKTGSALTIRRSPRLNKNAASPPQPEVPSRRLFTASNRPTPNASNSTQPPPAAPPPHAPARQHSNSDITVDAAAARLSTQTSKESKNKNVKSLNGGGNGKRSNAKNYSKSEVNWMLEGLQKFLPIGTMDWSDVKDHHDLKYEANERTVDSIRRKFLAMARVKMGTGDPLIPDHIREAKRIFKQIEEKSQGFDDLDAEVLGFGGVEEEEEAPQESATTAAVADSVSIVGSIARSTPSRRFVTPRAATASATSSVADAVMLQLLASIQRNEDNAKERERRFAAEQQERDRRWELEREDRRMMMMLMMERNAPLPHKTREEEKTNNTTDTSE